MLFWVATTDRGKEKVAAFDGKNTDLNFFEATILAASSRGLSIHNLIHAIRSDYPHTITDNHAVQKVRELERLGYLITIEEVTENTRVCVEEQIDGIDGLLKVKARLGDIIFFTSGIDKATVYSNLQWQGYYTVRLAFGTLKIELSA